MTLGMNEAPACDVCGMPSVATLMCGDKAEISYCSAHIVKMNAQDLAVLVEEWNRQKPADI